MVIVARTTTVPAAVASSVEPVIVAPVVPPSCTLQTMVLLVALDGATVVPVRRFKDVPTVAADGTPVMPVTGTNTVSVATLLVVVAVFVPPSRLSVMSFVTTT